MLCTSSMAWLIWGQQRPEAQRAPSTSTCMEGAGWWSWGAHLGPGAAQGLLEKQGEVADLALQAVVVVGEGAQRRLQRQQVGPDTCRCEAG